MHDMCAGAGCDPDHIRAAVTIPPTEERPPQRSLCPKTVCMRLQTALLFKTRSDVNCNATERFRYNVGQVEDMVLLLYL